jgi:hypothetical protein
MTVADRMDAVAICIVRAHECLEVISRRVADNSEAFDQTVDMVELATNYTREATEHLAILGAPTAKKYAESVAIS